MVNPEFLAISDFHKLAVLDLHGITPKRAEHTGRYWAYFSKDEVGDLLDEYDAGQLRVVARDFVSSINRVKDRIFELERARARSGKQNATAYR